MTIPGAQNNGNIRSGTAQFVREGYPGHDRHSLIGNHQRKAVGVSSNTARASRALVRATTS